VKSLSLKKRRNNSPDDEDDGCFKKKLSGSFQKSEELEMHSSQS